MTTVKSLLSVVQMVMGPFFEAIPAPDVFWRVLKIIELYRVVLSMSLWKYNYKTYIAEVDENQSTNKNASQTMGVRGCY